MTPADVLPRPTAELEPSPRWVRVRFAGQVVADSKRVLLLREPGRLPVYYFPLADVRRRGPRPRRPPASVPPRGAGPVLDGPVGDRAAEHAAWGHSDPPPDRLPLRDHVAFEWAKMDAWFEEDDEVYVHARDPYKVSSSPVRGRGGPSPR